MSVKNFDHSQKHIKNIVIVTVLRIQGASLLLVREII